MSFREVNVFFKSGTVGHCFCHICCQPFLSFSTFFIICYKKCNCFIKFTDQKCKCRFVKIKDVSYFCLFLHLNEKGCHYTPELGYLLALFNTNKIEMDIS